MPLSFIFCFFTIFALAQGHQPQKESSADIRANTIIFSIHDVNDEAKVILEKSSNLEYSLRYILKKNVEKVQKISGREAQKMDLDFASKFLKCQYELPPSEERCKVTLRLMMKGENLDICDKEDKKTREIAPFLKLLIERF
jgi:hypothetical protein